MESPEAGRQEITSEGADQAENLRKRSFPNLMPIRAKARQKSRNCFEKRVPASPVTPAGRVFLHKPLFDICIIAVLGFKDPIDLKTLKESLRASILQHKRFISIVKERSWGQPKWVQTEVDLDEHVIFATVGSESGADTVSDPVEEYASSLASAPPLDRSRPLWQLHVLSHPPRNGCRGSLIFRIHHALGDGTSLMSLLLACARQTSDPSRLPTLPQAPRKPRPSAFECLRRTAMVAVNTVRELSESTAMLLWDPDTKTALKGGPGTEKGSFALVSSPSISLDDIAVVRRAVHPSTTVNDVAMAAIAAGLRRYLDTRHPPPESPAANGGATAGRATLDLQEPLLDNLRRRSSPRFDIDNPPGALSGTNTPHASDVSNRETATAQGSDPLRPLPKNLKIRGLALVNLRTIPGLQELDEMMKGGSQKTWGNRMGYIVLKLPVEHLEDPLERVRRMKALIDSRKLSLGAHASWLTGYLAVLLAGAKGGASLTYRSLVRTTAALSNVVGPSESVTLFGNDLCTITPTVAGTPQSLTLHIQSYKGAIKFVCLAAAEFVPDPHLLCRFFVDAFHEMLAVATSIPKPC